ncbi:MAG: hypothetical protein ACRD9R_13710 [Pyrinomonadaceae bacterium]
MTLLISTLLVFLQAPGAERAVAEPVQMTAGGWVFLIGAWTFILGLVYYTFSKVLRGGKK